MGIRNIFIKQCEDNNLDNPWEYIKTLYKDGASCEEIAEIMASKHNVRVTGRHISNKMKEFGLARSSSEAKRNAMKRGRMVYKSLGNKKYKSKTISSKTRFDALERDGFKCVMCGNSPKTGYSLEVHHIDKDENDLENLQTLCYECHRGFHLKKREEEKE